MSTKTITFRNPSELTILLQKVDTTVSRLVLSQEYEQEELPGRSEDNTFELGGLFDRFHKLDALHIDAHLFSKILHHPSLRDLSLNGAVALTELDLPCCEILSLSLMGDVHGVACDISVLNPLLDNAHLPKLSSLDLRHVSAENHNRKPAKFLERIVAAPWFNQLRALGLFTDEITLAQLRKANFESLDFVVVSNLLSSFEKNPIKSGKVYFESDASPATLEQTLEKIKAFPASTPWFLSSIPRPLTRPLRSSQAPSLRSNRHRCWLPSWLAFVKSVNGIAWRYCSNLCVRSRAPCASFSMPWKS